MTENHPLRPSFELRLGPVTIESGLRVQQVTIKDRYHHRRYAVERKLFLAFTNALQRYLARRPQITFVHTRNIARTLTYIPSGIRAWSAYMPGGFATHPVHDPETKRLAHGQKIDFVTRRLFRHSIDAIGLRNRAHILAWVARQQAPYDKHRRWLSVASGSGQHVYDALVAIGSDYPYTVTITDIDQEVQGFARHIYTIVKPPLTTIGFELLDVLNPLSLSRCLKETRPSMIDAMGLIEYLSAVQAAAILRQMYEGLVGGGQLVFTNMSPANPHLDLHQRGLGWPGVLPRTTEQVAEILNVAIIPPESVTVYRSQDGVYNVYAVRKTPDS